MNEQLFELYLASKELNQLKWWEFSDLIEPILFINPDNGEIGYCVMMDYEIEIYLGERGIYSYLELINVIEQQGSEYEEFRSFCRQDKMSVSCEDRQDLCDDDYERIKSLGLSFRGKKQWPEFRRYHPGIIVEKLENREEIQFFTVILQQLKRLILDIKKGALSFKENKLLKMAFTNEKWQSEFIGFDELFKEELNPYRFDYKNDLTVHRLKKLPKVEMILEGTQFFLPEPILDKEINKGVFPLVTVFVEQSSEQVYFHEVSIHKEKDLKEIINKFANFMLNDLKFRPSEIIIEDMPLLDMIEDFCEQIGIESYSDYTPLANEFVESMLGLKEVEDLKLGLEEEEIPESVMNLVLELTQEFCEEIINHPMIMKLSKFDQDAVEAIAPVVIVDMVLDYQDMPPIWNLRNFDEYLVSGELQENVNSKFESYIYPSLIKFLECAGELNLLLNTEDLIKVTHKHFQANS